MTMGSMVDGSVDGGILMLTGVGGSGGREISKLAVLWSVVNGSSGGGGSLIFAVFGSETSGVLTILGLAGTPQFGQNRLVSLNRTPQLVQNGIHEEMFSLD